jgi:hypothetical protein
MRQVIMLELDLSTLRRAIGGGSYVRGAEYARQQAVQHVTWDSEETALRGTVRGQGGIIYQTAAFFSLADGQARRVRDGRVLLPARVQLQARRRAGPVGPGTRATGIGRAFRARAGGRAIAAATCRISGV